MRIAVRVWGAGQLGEAARAAWASRIENSRSPKGDLRARQPVYLASPINDASLFDPTTGYPEAIFAREMNILLNNGYTFLDDFHMVPETP
jgi:hypothetical protein